MEGVVNKVHKVLETEFDYVFIIQTNDDEDFWYWMIGRQYFDGKPSIEEAERFANDIDNGCIGCSVASFASISEAEADIMSEKGTQQTNILRF